MIRREKDGLIWFEFEIFQPYPELKHGVFSFHGGSSSGDFSSLNLSFTVGDKEENVIENRNRALSALSQETPPLLATGRLVHGDRIQIIKEKPTKELVYEETDGLITQNKNQALMLTHADCQIGLFYDPANKVLAAVHVGWRGNVQNVYQKAILQMTQEFGSCPHDIIAAISPSLGPDKSQFLNYKTELPEHFYPFQTAPSYFNLWEITKHQLQEAGVAPSNIQIAEMCTYSLEELFFSFRRNRKCGRNATIAYLSE